MNSKIKVCVLFESGNILLALDSLNQALLAFNAQFMQSNSNCLFTMLFLIVIIQI